MCVRVFDIWCAWYIMCVVVLSYKAEYFCLCQKNIVFFIFFFQSSFSSTWFISGARERYLCYYFSLSPFIRCSLRSRLCLLYLSVELFIFVTRYGKNDVCQFLAYLYYPRETFRITLASLHCPLFRMSQGCPVPEDVCGNTDLAEVCSPCARGCLHRDPAIRTDARVPFVLLLCPCAVWVSFCPPPRIHPSMSIVPPVLCCLCSKSVPFPYTSKPVEFKLSPFSLSR